MMRKNVGEETTEPDPVPTQTIPAADDRTKQKKHQMQEPQQRGGKSGTARVTKG